MRLIKSTAIMVVMIATPVAAAQWYEGGNLHQATGAQWRAASDANRLATSGDWVAGLRDQFRNPVKSMSQVKAMATELSACVTKAAEGPGGAKQEVAGLGAACMHLMGWFK